MNEEWSEVFDECVQKTKLKRWIKVVTLGSPHVGKSSLIKSFCEKKVPKIYRPTVGIDYGCTNVQLVDSEVMVTFWDMSGHDDYKLIRQPLYKDTDICLLVYDESSNESFSKLGEYYKEFKLHAGKYGNIVVVGNKLDAVGTKSKSRSELEKWTNGHKLEVHQVSSFDYEDVANMFRHVLTTLI